MAFYCWHIAKDGKKRKRICKNCKFLAKMHCGGQIKWKCTY